MKGKWAFFVGLGVGYVLGSRAGRERYEQIVAAARRVKDNPTLQEAAGLAQAQAGRLVGSGKGVLAEKLADSRLGHTRIAERLFGTHPYQPEAFGEHHAARPNGTAH
jgi:hypothetical protein